MASFGPTFCDITWGAGGTTADLTLDIAAKMQNMVRFCFSRDAFQRHALQHLLQCASAADLLVVYQHSACWLEGWMACAARVPKRHSIQVECFCRSASRP